VAAPAAPGRGAGELDDKVRATPNRDAGPANEQAAADREHEPLHEILALRRAEAVLWGSLQRAAWARAVPSFSTAIDWHP
jgi:hypothetical protein